MRLKCLMSKVHRETTTWLSQWEAAVLNVNKEARLALICIGIVLEREGGALGSILKFIKTKILDGCGLRHLDYDV
ncbi:hypothetical protein T459_00702 [Capsicum annuum]|uniref:Uncharacterized protein n=1 Tax=Capsicum annuum TaxID=4072 RepID=A0A2G3AF33_CAPAN|nr:hypothetical protein T459_00702 [Capsicum annuum]